MANGTAFEQACIRCYMVFLINGRHDVADVLFDAFRRDAVFGIIGLLLFAPTIGFGDGAVHGTGHFVGIKNDLAIHIAGSTANGLDERGFRTQEAFLVGVQNGDQRAFRNIEAFAQQVDADEHIESTQPQITQDFDALQRVDIRVHIAHADALLMHIFGEVFGHAFGERCDQRAIALQGRFATFGNEVIHLIFHRADDDGRVDQPRGADDLFGEHAACAFHFPFAGGGGDIDRLRAHCVPFFKPQRAVVDARWQAETIFGQGGFAVEVAFIHAANLWHGDMAFIHEYQRIVRQIFE